MKQLEHTQGGKPTSFQVKYIHVHAIDNPRTRDNQEYNLGLARAEAN